MAPQRAEVAEQPRRKKLRTTRRLAAGEAANVDDAALIQFGVAAAIDAGHDPRDVRRWSFGDLVHYVNYLLVRTPNVQ
jgi:hypothetical protein